MQVDMLAEVLPPRVQYRRHAQLPVEAFAVMPQGVERVPHCGTGSDKPPLDAA